MKKTTMLRVAAFLSVVVVSVPAMGHTAEHPGEQVPLPPLYPIFDELENLICDTYERHLGADTDNDGDPDCSDPDDDGDGLSDEYDIRFIGVDAHLEVDTDRDGIPDNLDLVPYKDTPVQIRISGTYEDHSKGECDWPESSMDRYVEDFDTITTYGSFDLTPPKGWSKSSAPSDPGYKEEALPTNDEWVKKNTDKVKAFQGAQDLADWNHVNGVVTQGVNAAAPQFHFMMTMMDKDMSDDDWIIVAGKSAEALFKFPVGAELHTGVLKGSNSLDCIAQVKHEMKSNVDGGHVGGLLAYQHGIRPVTIPDAIERSPRPIMSR